MKKLNSFITFKSAALSLLMLILCAPAWAGYCQYDSSTKCLKVYCHSYDNHRINKEEVRKATGFSEATSIWFDPEVKYIETEAFSGMPALESLTIPSTIKDIYAEAFSHCANLKTVRFEAGESSIVLDNYIYWNSATGEHYAGDGIFAYSNVETIYCDRNFSGYYTMTGSEYENYPPLSSRNTTLKEIVIGPNMTSIARNLFRGCSNLTKLDLSKATNLAEIHTSAFAGSALTNVMTYSKPTIEKDAFPSNTYVIDRNATYQEWLDSYKNKATVTELYIPNDNVANYASFTTSNNLATLFPNVKKVTFSPYVTEIGENIFYGSKTLETLVFEGDPVAVGKYSFQGCSRLATIEGKIKSVLTNSFHSCSSLTQIEITDDENIDLNAFRECSSLERVTLPSNLKTITMNAFLNCTALTKVTIPTSVTSVQSSAFKGCTALTYVIINSPTVAATSYTADNNLTTRFPALKAVRFGGGVQTIGNYAFAGSENLEQIVEPVSDTKAMNINAYAFSNCTKLTTFPLAWSNVVETIGEGAFKGCTSLTEIPLTAEVAEIKASTFAGCKNLKSLVLGEVLTSFDKSAVEGCTSLTDLRIFGNDFASKGWKETENLHHIFPYVTALTYGPNVTEVGPWTFHANESETGSLQSITFKNASGVDIKWNAFDNNKALTTVEGNVKNIGAYAFSGCSQLQEISFTNDAEEIEVYAFKGCTSLTSITLAKELKILRQSSFEGCTNLKSVTFNGSNITPDNTEKQWTSNYNFCTIFPYVERIAFAPAARLVASSAFSCGVNKNPHPLKSVRFWGITEVEKDAFYNQENLTTVEGRLKSAGESAFEGTSIESITFDDTYATPTIGNNAFAYCSSLKTVKLSNRIETIGQMAFFRCASLTEIVIPDRVSEIQDLAFFNTGLMTVVCKREDPINISNVVFDGITTQRAQLIVPTQSIEAYKAAEGWKNFYKITDAWGADGIDGIKMDSKKTTGIFTLDGKKVSDAENLPSGIYIKNGKKVVIK